VRLGDGTEESHRRTQDAVNALWPYTGELFERDDVLDAMIAEGVAADPQPLREVWDGTIGQAFALAGVTAPLTRHFQTGGREGIHTEALGHILADMQFLQRAYPGAKW